MCECVKAEVGRAEEELRTTKINQKDPLPSPLSRLSIKYKKYIHIGLEVTEKNQNRIHIQSERAEKESPKQTSTFKKWKWARKPPRAHAPKREERVQEIDREEETYISTCVD